MADSNDQDRKKLSLSGRGKLSLSKSVETAQVRQSFSHGRSKTVQVEVRDDVSNSPCACAIRRLEKAK